MPTHVAPLRGINVGGRNRVAMADLRQVVAEVVAGNPFPDEPNPRRINWATVNKLLALCDG